MADAQTLTTLPTIPADAEGPVFAEPWQADYRQGCEVSDLFVMHSTFHLDCPFLFTLNPYLVLVFVVFLPPRPQVAKSVGARQHFICERRLPSFF
jgi:hypothetical protein